MVDKMTTTNIVPISHPPSPIEKFADLEMDGRVDLQNLLCLWAAELKQSGLRKDCRSHRILRVWVPHTNRKRRRGIRRCRIPPRRAHGTLQPQDESIIVGYYTSAEVSPKTLPHITNQKYRRKCLWQEATVFIVPAQEI